MEVRVNLDRIILSCLLYNALETRTRTNSNIKNDTENTCVYLVATGCLHLKRSEIQHIEKDNPIRKPNPTFHDLNYLLGTCRHNPLKYSNGYPT